MAFLRGPAPCSGGPPRDGPPVSTPFLGAAVQNGTIDLSAGLSASFNNPDNDPAGRLFAEALKLAVYGVLLQVRRVRGV